MKNMNEKIKKKGIGGVSKRFVSVLAAIALVIASFSLPQPLQTVCAAGTVNAPSTGTFWTNDDIKGIAGIGDAPYYVSGTTFQKANYAGRTWFVIGKETVSGNDTLVLLSQSPLGTSRFDSSSTTYSTSFLNKGLNNLLSPSDWRNNYNVNTVFGADAKAYVQPVTVSGAANSYLYIPDGNTSDKSNFKVGSNNQYKIPISTWKSNGGSLREYPYYFWLRSAAYGAEMYSVWTEYKGGTVDTRGMDSTSGSIVPIFNLNLSSGLFASAAPAATSDTTADVTVNGTMTFRITDSTKIKSSATYVGSSVRVIKSDDDSQPVYLCVQYNDGTSDKIYTKAFPSTGTVDLSSIGDLTNAKIWVETKSSDSKVVYASMAQVHSHSWTRVIKTTNKTDDTLSVYCTSGCTTGLVDADHAASLTVIANDMVYSGSSYDGASLSGTTEWEAAGLPVLAILYEGRGGTTYSSSTTPPTDKGKYTAGIVYYGNQVRVDFVISDKIPQTITASDITATYGDTGKSIGATLSPSDGTLSYAIKSGSATDVVDVDAAGNLTINKAGNTIVTITAIETTTYNSATKDVHVTVNAKTLTDSMVSLDQSAFINDGNGHAPIVTVKDGATTLGVITDYTLSGDTASKTANGNYTITVTGTGNYTGTVNKSWSIADKLPQTITASDITATYGDTGKSIGAILSTGDGTLSYAIKSGSATDVVDVDAAGNLTINKAGSTIVTVTASETSTYASATKDVYVTVDAKTLTDSMVSLDQSTFITDGNGHAPVVTVKDGATILVDTTDYTLSGDTASKTDNGNYTITVTGTGNYVGTVNKSWCIADFVTYTVSFEANGGSGTMTNVAGISGSYTLPSCMYTAPSNKQFKGWATSASGSIVTGTIDVRTDITLYAIWEDTCDGKDSEDEEKRCDHDYVWMVIKEPTLTTDGKLAYKCVKCGNIDSDHSIQLISAYKYANDEAVKQIKRAEQGSTISIDFGVFNTFMDYLLEAIKARPDLTIKFQYKVGKVVYERVVNAGTDLPAEFPKYAGPHWLDVYFAENVIKELAY